jgi:hypothetical protein
MRRELWRSRAICAGLLGAFIGVMGGCGDDDNFPSQSSVTAHPLVIFNEENEDMNAYDATDGFRKQVVVSGGEDEHAGGFSLNGQICFAPDGSHRFVTGDDAGQPQITPGWTVFQLHGKVGAFSVTKITKLVPTYQDAPDNYGCGFLHDGRILTTDIGNNASGPGDGQLIVWFPPFDVPSPRYCKLDITIGTAGGIFVDSEERIYVASARVDPGIFRYTGPFPTSDDAAGGCGSHDATGAPLADNVHKEKFIAGDANVRTPNAVVGTSHGTFFVSSIFNGVIAEYGADGKFIRRILQPPVGEGLGPQPYSTGSPLGLGIDSSGTVYYADLALVFSTEGIGPSPHAGTVRRIRFENGAPLPPEIIDSGLNFPDGIGVLEE